MQEFDLTGLPEHVQAVYELEKLINKRRPNKRKIRRLRKIAAGGEVEVPANNKRRKISTKVAERLGLDIEDYKKRIIKAEKADIPREYVNRRLATGWSLERATTTPVQRYKV